MDEFIVEIRVVERHQLKRPFEKNRLDRKSLAPLVASLKEHGQQLPITVIGDPEGTGAWNIIDGGRRFEALGICESDTIMVEIWNGDVATGLLRVLARESNRKREPLEEAGLIQELIDGGKSKSEIARSLGKSVSWISRRLKLLEEIRVAWWQGLREGWLKPWALERVVIPLARANEKHAHQLTAAMKKESIPTRDLKTWFEHYGRKTKLDREKMANEPHLFLAGLAAMDKAKKAKRLAAGLEGQCLKDVGILLQVSRRLAKTLPRLWSEGMFVELETLKSHMKKTYELLESMIQRFPRREDESETREDSNGMDPK